MASADFSELGQPEGKQGVRVILWSTDLAGKNPHIFSSFSIETFSPLVAPAFRAFQR
jgi:hypothetical protein